MRSSSSEALLDANRARVSPHQHVPAGFAIPARLCLGVAGRIARYRAQRRRLRCMQLPLPRPEFRLQYLGLLCGRARLRTGHGGATSSVLSVQCIKEPTLANGDDDGGEGKKRSFRTPSRLVLGVFSGTHAIWQHQMMNGLPNLGMLMPLMHYAGVANVSLLHNGLLDATANTIGQAVSPADCHGSPTSWHLLRVGVDVRSGHEIQNLVLPIPMPRYMGHEDSYPSFAYSWTTGGRHKVGQGVHSHGLAQTWTR
jgi:hypothetical protein